MWLSYQRVNRSIRIKRDERRNRGAVDPGACPLQRHRIPHEWAPHQTSERQTSVLLISNASIFFEFSMRVTGFALDTQERILATGQSLEDLLGNPLPESAYRLYHAMEAILPIRRCLDDECRMLNDAMRRRLTGQILKIFDPGRSPVTARFIPFERFIEDEWQPEEATDEDVFLEFVDMDMFSIEDDCVLTRQNITCLISLALIQNPVLIDAFLEGKDVVKLLDVDVSIASSETQRRCWPELAPEKLSVRQRDGTMVQFLGFLCHVIGPTDVLMHYIAEMTVEGSKCPSWYTRTPYIIGELLNGVGVDVNASDYAVTPLQILVEKRSPHFSELLQHGADPNRTGRIGGRTLRRLSLRWSQATPLHINRELARFDSPQDTTADEISKLLESRGGRDFVREAPVEEEGDD